MSSLKSSSSFDVLGEINKGLYGSSILEVFTMLTSWLKTGWKIVDYYTFNSIRSCLEIFCMFSRTHNYHTMNELIEISVMIFLLLHRTLDETLLALTRIRNFAVGNDLVPVTLSSNSESSDSWFSALFVNCHCHFALRASSIVLNSLRTYCVHEE